MNRKALALSLAAVAVTGVTVASLSTSASAAAPKYRCVLHVVMYEDQSFSGKKVVLDGKKIADFWKVNDYRIYGTITPDQWGRMNYNTDSSMSVNGLPCGFAVDRGAAY